MAVMPELAQDYVIFDVETTGLKPEEGHAVVEMAAERVRGASIIDTFEAIVNPERKIDAEAAAVHGITDEVVKRHGKPLIEVMPAFMLFCSGAILVAHNIRFDLSFVNSHLLKLGLPTLTNPLLDTLELAKQKVSLASYSLAYLAKHFQIHQPKAHRAMADVEVTRELLFKLLALPESLKK